MKYIKHIYNIKNNKCFIVHNESIFFYYKNFLRKNHLYKNETSIKIKLHNSLNAIYLLKDKLLVLSKDNTPKLFDFELNQIDVDFSNYKVVPFNYKLDIMIIEEFIDLFNRRYGIFDTSTYRALYLKKNFYPSHIFSHDYIFGTPNNCLVKYDFNTGDELWKLDFSTCQEIKKQICSINITGLINNTVYIIVNDNSIIEVCAVKGIIKYTWIEISRELEFTNEKYEDYDLKNLNQYGISNTTILLNNEQKIVGFKYNIYWELDLLSKKITSYSLYNNFKSLQISGCWTKFVLKGDYIYFISDQMSDWIKNKNHKIVVFDRIEQKVIYDWQLPQKNGYLHGFTIDGPVIFDNYICALEQNETLHIFTK